MISSSSAQPFYVDSPQGLTLAFFSPSCYPPRQFVHLKKKNKNEKKHNKNEILFILYWSIAD